MEDGSLNVVIDYIINGKHIEYKGQSYWLDYTGFRDYENIILESEAQKDQYFPTEADLMHFLNKSLLD